MTQEEEPSAEPSTGPNEITFRFRTLARGFRRRCSNLAWALGGFALAGLCVLSLVEDHYDLPDILEFLVMAGGAPALGVVAVSALVSRIKSRERWFTRIEVDGSSVSLTGKGRRSLRLQDIQGVVSSGKICWIVLRNGDLDQLLFFRERDAKRAEELFPSHLRASPLELAPTPTGARQVLVLFLVGTILASIAEGLWGLPVAAWLSVLSITMAASAFWRRGARLVVASDGVRVGSRFFSLDRLTNYTSTQTEVSWTHASVTRRAKVQLPEGLAFALELRVRALIRGEAPIDAAPIDAALERRDGEDVHAWLRRVTALFRGGDFREPALSKERVLAAVRGKGPLRVRVAALAALKDDAPELVEAIGRASADPRFLRALAAVDDEAWRKVVDALERRGELEAER